MLGNRSFKFRFNEVEEVTNTLRYKEHLKVFLSI